MKKAVCFLLIAGVLSLLPFSRAFAEEEQEFVDLSALAENSLRETDFSDWELFVKNDYFSGISGRKSLKDFISDIASGSIDLKTEGLISKALSEFRSEIAAHMLIASGIFGLAVLSALLTKLSNGNTSKEAGKLLLLAAVLLTFRGFSEAIKSSLNGLSIMSDFIRTVLPFLLSLSTGSGQMQFGSDLLMMAEGVSLLTEKVIIPLTTGVFVLNTANFISQNNFFQSISSSMKSFTDWLSGIMFSVFFGFTGVQKLISQSLQGSTAKAVKYTLTSFSLYGGTFLSKSFDIVTACSVIVKGIIGSAGMIVLLTLAISPAIRLLAASLVYRIASVFVSATGEEKITAYLEMTGKVYGSLFLLVATTAILFFVFLSAVSAGAGALLGI